MSKSDYRLSKEKRDILVDLFDQMCTTTDNRGVLSLGSRLTEIDKTLSVSDDQSSRLLKILSIVLFSEAPSEDSVEELSAKAILQAMVVLRSMAVLRDITSKIAEKDEIAAVRVEDTLFKLLNSVTAQ